MNCDLFVGSFGTTKKTLLYSQKYRSKTIEINFIASTISIVYRCGIRGLSNPPGFQNGLYSDNGKTFSTCCCRKKHWNSVTNKSTASFMTC